MDTATSWISKTPGDCGGDACIRTTRHTVAGLVEWKQLGLTDARILEHHPDLSQADFEAAWPTMLSNLPRSNGRSARMPWLES
jgi:uncharacterized protein (DUF433 family)